MVFFEYSTHKRAEDLSRKTTISYEEARGIFELFVPVELTDDLFNFVLKCLQEGLTSAQVKQLILLGVYNCYGKDLMKYLLKGLS